MFKSLARLKEKLIFEKNLKFITMETITQKTNFAIFIVIAAFLAAIILIVMNLNVVTVI